MTSQSKIKWLCSALLCLGMLACLVVSSAGQQVTIKVLGTVTPDSPDTMGLFGVGPNLKGQPFTLTITFDASKAETTTDNLRCTGSSVKGSTADGNPARAVLHIGKGSYAFGTKPESKWEAWRAAPSNCYPTGELSFGVFEGSYPHTSLLRMPMKPVDGKKMGSNVGWNEGIPSMRIGVVEQFLITRPGDFEHMVRGRLSATSMSMTVGGAEAGTDTPAEADTPAQAGGSGETAQANETGQSAKPSTGGLKGWLKQNAGGLLKKLPQLPSVPQ
jgi:hypothetical protein